MSRLRKSKAFAVKLKDSQKLEHSSSGGAFTAISDVFCPAVELLFLRSITMRRRKQSLPYMVPPR